MTRKRKAYNGPLLRYQYHLGSRNPLVLSAKTYDMADQHPWLDIHEGLEIGIVLKGRSRRYWGSIRKDIEPGDIWMCDTCEPHGYQIMSASCDIVCAILLPDLLKQMRLPCAPHIDWTAPFRVPPRTRHTGRPSERSAVLAAGRRLAAFRDKTDVSSLLSIQLLIAELLRPLVEDQEGTIETEMTPHVTTRSAIAPAVQLAQTSRTLVTVDQAAASCKLSEDGFGRMFAREMGISFAKFAVRCRINNASGELVHTSQPVKAIAGAWGFSDESHLHRVFLRHFGCSPRTYRLRSRGRKRP